MSLECINFYSKLIILLFTLPLIPSKYWEKHYLTYSVENNTFLTNEVNEAVLEWNVSSLEFKQVDSGKGDIKIYFITLPSPLLGRAYFPPVGIIHIRDTIRGNVLKISLQHEFGHALGLDHNNNRTSIMFDVFTSVNKLSENDLLSLNEIYRCRYDSITLLNYFSYFKFQGTHYERIDFTTGYTTNDKIWHSSIVKVDAMYRNNSYFIISNENYYKFDNVMNFVENGSIQYLFPNIQGKLESVLTLRNGSIVAFLDNKTMWYNDRVFKIRFHFPNKKIQGAYQLFNRNIVLNTQDIMWIYDANFTFIEKQYMCDAFILGKIHCCNEYSNT